MKLQVSDLTVKYNNAYCAVNRISVTLEQGLTGLIGPNGAGKTTFMKALATLIVPASGQIILNGYAVSEKNMKELRHHIGYLPQSLGFHKNLNVVESLHYYGMLQEICGRDREKRIEQLLRLTNLEEHQHKKIRQLSGGMKRRLGLAQALINDPEILIVDEPTAGLDPEERINIRMLLSSLAAGKIILLSTHVVEDIASACSRVIILEKGHVAFEGLTTEIIQAAEGHVYVRTTRNEEEVLKLRSCQNVTGIVYDIDGIHVRYVSMNQSETGNPVSPSLEDAYIYTRQRYLEGDLS